MRRGRWEGGDEKGRVRGWRLEGNGDRKAYLIVRT